MSTEKEEDVAVLTPEEKPEEIEVKVEKTEKAAPPVIPPEEGIDRLKRQLQQSEAMRIEAEKRAHEAARQASKAKVEVSDANYQMVKGAIKTLHSRADQLKSVYAEAMNVGDHARAAEAQQAMAQAASQLSQLEQGKKAMKKQLKEAEKVARQQKNTPFQPQVAIADQLAAQVSPASAQWLRDNRDRISDEKTVKRMFRAHEDAVDDGITVDTPEYFSFIESRLGIHRDQQQQAEPLSAAAQPRRATPPPPAPVSRAAPSRPGVVRLSSDQVETAKALGMTPEEYAKNLVQLKKEGRI
jgi:hypothetical protein